MWAWKYGLSLRAAITNVKASFSIGEGGGVSLFYASECLACVVYKLLYPVLFFDQGSTDGCWGDGQVEKQFFP